MKTRTIIEDVSGTLNRRYFAEIDLGSEINMRHEGTTTQAAAASLVARLRYLADDAERKFIESGVLESGANRPNTR